LYCTECNGAVRKIPDRDSSRAPLILSISEFAYVAHAAINKNVLFGQGQMTDCVKIVIAIKIGVDDPVHPGQTGSSAPTISADRKVGIVPFHTVCRPPLQLS